MQGRPSNDLPLRQLKLCMSFAFTVASPRGNGKAKNLRIAYRSSMSTVRSRGWPAVLQSFQVSTCQPPHFHATTSMLPSFRPCCSAAQYSAVSKDDSRGARQLLFNLGPVMGIMRHQVHESRRSVRVTLLRLSPSISTTLI